MWRHRAYGGQVLVLFHASAGVAIQGTWLQVAGLSRFGFPFGGLTPPTTPPHRGMCHKEEYSRPCSSHGVEDLPSSIARVSHRTGAV